MVPLRTYPLDEKCLIDLISSNYNYGACGQAISQNLLSNPDLVATDPTVSFQSALWFWMTPQSLKPSCHAVMTGQWTPSAADQSAGRLPGYGVVTDIINGGVECGIRYNWESSRSDRVLQAVLRPLGCQLWQQLGLL